MADLPKFVHIHCSSRFDRSAAQLDYDITNWQSDASIITLTEVQNDQRAAQLRAQGWGYYNVRNGNFADDCAIAWDSSVWKAHPGTTLKLTTDQYQRAYSKKMADIYCVTTVLTRVDTNHKLLVSVCHMPAHIEGPDGWRTVLDQWKGRKHAYLSAMTAWSTHVQDQMKKQKIDAALIVADWNLNLKTTWFQGILSDHWGWEYDIAWKRFPTDGGSLTSHASVPKGAPGKGYHDRIIDGSLLNALDCTKGPELMSRVSSSDHRPYKETLAFTFYAGTAAKDKKKKKGRGEVGQKASIYTGYGDVFHGEAWWGFGDYMDDEIYFTPTGELNTGEAGGEVL